jgi:hypothetical protein
MILRLATDDPQAGFSNQCNGDKGAPARALTVSAMTIEHGDGRFRTFIADGAAEASALIGNIDRKD